MQRLIASSLTALLAVGTLPYPAFAAGSGGGDTATPIKHLVVIFRENISFDHYFGTYPYAAKSRGRTLHRRRRNPGVNGLNNSLLFSNPNLLNAGNGTGAANPFRLDRSQAATATRTTTTRPNRTPSTTA